VLAIGALFLGTWKHAILFGIANGALHYMVDFVTSRIITWQAKKLQLSDGANAEEKPLFERLNLYSLSVLLGVDQLLHQVCLMLTLPILL